MTHQAKDLYVVTSYATLGFFIGMLAYTQYVIRFRQECNSRVRVISLYVWVGICAVAACLFLLIQQHWYPESPVWSSTVTGSGSAPGLPSPADSPLTDTPSPRVRSMVRVRSVDPGPRVSARPASE